MLKQIANKGSQLFADSVTEELQTSSDINISIETVRLEHPWQVVQYFFTYTVCCQVYSYTSSSVYLVQSDVAASNGKWSQCKIVIKSAVFLVVNRGRLCLQKLV